MYCSYTVSLEYRRQDLLLKFVRLGYENVLGLVSRLTCIGPCTGHVGWNKISEPFLPSRISYKLTGNHGLHDVLCGAHCSKLHKQ